MQKDFQDGGYLGFPIETILTIFYLPSFMSSGVSVQENKLTTDFEHGGRAAIFYLLSMYKSP